MAITRTIGYREDSDDRALFRCGGESRPGRVKLHGSQLVVVSGNHRDGAEIDSVKYLHLSNLIDE